MAKFNKSNFKKIIIYIESMEKRNENIWVPIGILETMYDDDVGYIDKYFHTNKFDRNLEKLLEKFFDK